MFVKAHYIYVLESIVLRRSASISACLSSYLHSGYLQQRIFSFMDYNYGIIKNNNA